MGTIRILPEKWINQIAAGEVVKRPASVVKELMENAVDAQATEIQVFIEVGGKRLIRVADNGLGMDRDDALLAVQRHTTSKLRTLEDLWKPISLGFRGEALASISAVSRFTLQTRPQGGEGTRLWVNFGTLQGVEPYQGKPGTVVTVEHLFSRLPARRKFLRSTQTETAHIREVFQSLALAFPYLRFDLTVKGGKKIILTPKEHREARLREILGEELFSQLVHLQEEEGAYRVELYVGREYAPIHAGRWVYLFVNRRPVQDRLLVGLVRDVLKERLPNVSRPSFFLFLELPPEDVDVNVHPTKAEVRFRRIDLLRNIIQKVRSHSNLSHPKSMEKSRIFSFPQSTGQHFIQPPATVAERTAPLYSTTADQKGAGVPFRLLGIAMEAFILFEKEETLWILDQHAAHERVTYEKLLALREGRYAPTQNLLQPRSLSFPMGLGPDWEEKIQELKNFGLEVDLLGEETLVLRSIPSFLTPQEGEKMVYAFWKNGLNDPHKAFMAGMACRQSVRFSHPLSPLEAQKLLEDLLQCQDPYHCPHGRPTALVFDRRELERHFGR